jgi:hypothetical protein
MSVKKEHKERKEKKLIADLKAMEDLFLARQAA